MSLPELATIERKIEYLQEQIDILEKNKDTSLVAIQQDVKTRYFLERALQLAMEAILDSSRMLVLCENWTIPKSEPHAVSLLAEHAVISAELSQRLLGAKGFRNILVHEYERIDPKKVHAFLRDGLDDLKEFSRSLASYLSDKHV